MNVRFPWGKSAGYLRKGCQTEQRDVRQNRKLDSRRDSLKETLESEKQRRCNSEVLKGEIKKRFWRKRGDEGSKGKGRRRNKTK